MRTGNRTRIGTFACMFVLLAAGCNQPESKSGQSKQPPKTELAKTEKPKDHQHSGWWCDEHGVPESMCGQCDAKLAAQFKKKGDWCKEHDRPDSQCFIHHPELKDKFAAMYRAKYGKEPPLPEDESKEPKN